MLLLHLKCDSRLESIFKPGIYWCPSCEVEVNRDEIYRVGKRFFATGVGARLLQGGRAGSIQAKSRDVKNQKRKKLHSLRTKQQRHMRKKGGK